MVARARARALEGELVSHRTVAICTVDPGISGRSLSGVFPLYARALLSRRRWIERIEQRGGTLPTIT